MIKEENTQEELVSVCILTYRNFEGIFDTLASLFEQNYPYIELIISDDNSPNYEDNISYIQKYINERKGENIKGVIYNQMPCNVGTVKHMNTVLKLANGVYIKSLGGGDYFSSPDSISQYVSFLEEKNYEICFAKMRGVRPDGEYVYHLAACEDDYELLRNLSPEQTMNKLFARNFLPAPAWCARKELFKKNGYYSEETRLIEDYPYWIHLCQNGVKFGYIDDRLIEYKLDGVSSGGFYSEAFMDDMMVIYERSIFPYDKRFGKFQFIYNFLKRQGLNAYYAKARWKKFSMKEKVLAYIKYGIYFIYIYCVDLKYKIKNKK